MGSRSHQGCNSLTLVFLLEGKDILLIPKHQSFPEEGPLDGALNELTEGAVNLELG